MNLTHTDEEVNVAASLVLLYEVEGFSFAFPKKSSKNNLIPNETIHTKTCTIYQILKKFYGLINS